MKLRKILAILLSLILICGVVPIGAVSVSAETEGYFTYEVENGKVTITGCDSSISGDLVLPATIDGYPVEEIGSRAFYGNNTITSIVIPEGVKVISTLIFFNSKSLKSVTIPSTVSFIGAGAFSDCDSLTNITVHEDNTYYSSSDDILFNKAKTEILCYPAGKTNTSYELPNSVNIIGEGAFYGCDSINYITMPDSIKKIVTSAFYSCTKLQSIRITENVESIGISAFYNCHSLKTIIVASGNKYYSSYDGVLYNKAKTQLICYPMGKENEECTVLDTVTEICDQAFYGCKNIKTIVIPKGVTSIGRRAFSYCEKLENVTISTTVTNIGSQAFYFDTALKNVYYQGTEEQWATMNVGIFNTYEPGIALHMLSYGVSRLNFIVYKIENGKAIVTGCEEGVSRNVVIPSQIGIYPVEEIGSRAFYGNNTITSIVIPEGVKVISTLIFFNSKSLKSVTIPSTVSFIGAGAFSDCDSLTNITVHEDNTYYSSSDDILFNKAKTEILCYPAGKTNTSYELPNSVNIIGEGAFYGCDSINYITMPDSIKKIVTSAFYSCTKLQSIRITENVESIGISAFYNCHSLKTIIVASGNKYYSSYDGVLYNKAKTQLICYPMGKENEECTVLDTVTEICDQAFYGCKNIKTIVIPKGVTSIGRRAFSYCEKLENVTISTTVTNIGSQAFYFDTALKNVYYQGTEEQWATMNVGIFNTYEPGIALHMLSYGVSRLNFIVYKIENGKAIVTGCEEGVSRNVVIPSQIGIYP